MTKSYNTARIRALLTNSFSAEELRRFCFDNSHFESVYDELASNTGKDEIIDKMLEHAKLRSLFWVILDWAQEKNPNRFGDYYPYHYPTIFVELIVTNTGSDTKTFSIPKGQLFEVKDIDLNYQNVVTSEDIQVTLGPEETRTVKIPGMCINPFKKWPNEAEGSVTPFRQSTKFSTQEDVWKAFGKGVPTRA